MQSVTSALRRRTVGLLAGCVVAALWLAPAASAATTTFRDVHSAGPLSDIYAGQDLSCQVGTTQDSSTEFYPGAASVGDCGTFLGIDSDDVPEQLFGPDFTNHSAGTQFVDNNEDYSPFSEDAQSPVTGSGTQADPYTVTTDVSGVDPDDGSEVDFTIEQVDQYVAGQDFYTSTATVTNTDDPDGGDSLSAQLYHAADCNLRGSDTGYGASTGGTPACTVNANDSPASAAEEFVPQTTDSAWVENAYGTQQADGTTGQIWGDVDEYTDLPDLCDCSTLEDNAMGIDWSLFLEPQDSAMFTWETKVDTPPLAATGGHHFNGTSPASVGGALAGFTDSDAGTTPASYTATVNWGDGTIQQNPTITGSNGSFAVNATHQYSSPGSYPVTVTVGYVGNSASDVTATDSAEIAGSPTGAPSPVTTGPATAKTTSAALTGSVTDEGLPTTAYYEYGLDSSDRGPGFNGSVYDERTTPQSVGFDFSSHPVPATITNLQPNSLYHVRLVATDSAGTTVGPDRTFRTAALPAAPPPVLGKENITPVGNVFVLLNGKFVKLTQGRQLPSGTEIDTLGGSINLVSASGKPGHRFTGTFGGAVFKFQQVFFGPAKGLTVLSLVEGAFKGAPSYNSCTAHGAADAHAALSSRILQTLRSKASGRFRTRGRYASATVLGTKWTTTDRCNGTLISVQVHSILVTDLIKHITILLHAGQHYLAKPKHHP